MKKSTKLQNKFLKEIFIVISTVILLAAMLFSSFLLKDKKEVINNSNAAVNPIYWGAYIDYGQGTAAYSTTVWDKFEADTGKKISIQHWGQAWKNGSGVLQNFPTSVVEGIRTRGAIPMLDWGSWIAGAGSNQPNFKLTTITSGTYDSYIRQWATDAKAWGKPMFLRYDWEMNIGGQFPWNISDGVNTATDYINMWRHVHDIFTSVGATNITWVWCPNIYFLSGSNAKPFMQVYPGDNYVDWTGLDGYNFGNNWDSFSTIFTDSYKTLMGNVAGVTGAPSKPIMLGEWASNEAGDGGAKKAAWINDALQTQLPNNFPNIKAVVWFNWNAGSQNWQIESTAASQTAFLQSINSTYYVAGSTDLSNLPLLTPIQPPSTGITPTATFTPTFTPTKTPLPTATFTPIPTSTFTPTITPRPTSTFTPVPTTVALACAPETTSNVCNNACTFNKMSGISYGVNGDGKISYVRESNLGSTPTSTDIQNYCNRPNRTKGDADGLNGIDPTDYLYYVRVVNGGNVPSWVNTDFDGDGSTSRSDRDIVIANLQ